MQSSWFQPLYTAALLHAAAAAEYRCGIVVVLRIDLFDRQQSGRSASDCILNTMDCGAGVGRVTCGVLLSLAAQVNAVLVEQSSKWQEISRGRCAQSHNGDRCKFIQSGLESFSPHAVQTSSGSGEHDTGQDVIWIQWTLQYLIDADVVGLLCRLRSALSITNGGFVVLKENRPHMAPGVDGAAAEGTDLDRFQMDTPKVGGRFDIARSDAHLRVLIELAGLSVEYYEKWDEVGCYVLVAICDQVVGLI